MADVEKLFDPHVLKGAVNVDVIVLTSPPVVTPVNKKTGAGDPVIPQAVRPLKFQYSKIV